MVWCDPLDIEVCSAEEEDAVEAEEGEKPRILPDPGLPTQKQRDEHDATHLPYRSWCSHCVRGAGRCPPHRKVEGQYAESTLARVHLDYCFFTENGIGDDGEPEKTTLTTLVMKETSCSSVWAYPVAHKGATMEPWVVKQLLYDMETVGLNNERIVVKVDQEASIKELQKAIANARGGETALEEARVGDSNSNARIEVAVQEEDNMTRVLKSALEERIKSPIKLDHPVVPWLIRHAAANITRHKIRQNGRTAFQQMKGYKGVMPIG